MSTGTRPNVTISSWVSDNALRNYPLSDSATCVDVNNTPLSPGILVDMCLSSPDPDLYVSCLAIHENLVSITISNSEDPILLGTFNRKAIKPYAVYRLDPLDHSDINVAGLVTFGSEISTTHSHTYIFNPEGGKVHPGAINLVNSSRVTSIKGSGGVTAATGDVTFEGRGGVDIKVSGNNVTIGLTQAAYKELAGYTTSDNVPIHTINNVEPDNTGTITIRFK